MSSTTTATRSYASITSQKPNNQQTAILVAVPVLAAGSRDEKVVRKSRTSPVKGEHPITALRQTQTHTTSSNDLHDPILLAQSKPEFDVLPTRLVPARVKLPSTTPQHPRTPTASSNDRQGPTLHVQSKPEFQPLPSRTNSIQVNLPVATSNPAISSWFDIQDPELEAQSKRQFGILSVDRIPANRETSLDWCMKRKQEILALQSSNRYTKVFAM